MLIQVETTRGCNKSVDEGSQRKLSVRLARSWSEVEAAQRLRWRVFAGELGAKIDSQALGVDHDRFDDHCDHLLAIDSSTGRVVGTYRILPPERAQRMGGGYSETEFDLKPLEPLRASMAEIGRSCIDPAWRGSPALGLLWSGLFMYAKERHYRYMVGCASVPITDGGRFAANLYASLQPSLVDPEWRVRPRVALDHQGLATGESVIAPTLIRGYLRAGARIGGAPALDRQFNTADFLMLLSMDQVDGRFARRFEASAPSPRNRVRSLAA